MAPTADLAERLRMFGKLFTLYPTQKESVELKIRAYIDETRDIPAVWLSHALRRLVRKAEEFAPSVGAIRKEAAHVVRESHRRALGLEPGAGIPADGINVDRWLEKAHEPIPSSHQLTSGAVPAEKPADLATRAKGAALLADLVARMDKRS